MSRKLPILTLLILVASGGVPDGAAGQIGPTATPRKGAASAPVADPGTTPGPPQAGTEDLLAKAIAAMDARPSVSAKTSHQVSLFERSQVLGTGRYVEQRSPRGRLFRLDLRLTLDGQKTHTLVEVFDGRYLWKYQDLGSGKLTKVDLDEVNRVLRKGKRLTETAAPVGMRPGLGGLSKLLRGLDEAFTFTVVEQTDFLAGEQSTERELPAWKLHGSWRPERLVKVLPDQADDIKAGKPANLAKLPEHLPDHVILYLGKEDLFPYQIDYRRATSGGILGGENSRSRSILTMRFTEVDFGRRIDESEFHYRPGRDTPEGLTPVDGTQAFLASPELKNWLRSTDPR